MTETPSLEQAVFKIQRLLKWFETEANIDKALSTEGGPIEQRKRTIEHIGQLAQLISATKEALTDKHPEKLWEIEEEYASAVEALEAYRKTITDKELNAARAFHSSQDTLNQMLSTVSRYIQLVKPTDENPLIRKIIELKQRVGDLEAERDQLLDELHRLKGGEEPVLETSPFQTPHVTTQDNLQQEIEKLRAEKETAEFNAKVQELIKEAKGGTIPTLVTEAPPTVSNPAEEAAIVAGGPTDLL